jgi:hypothetical protein
VTWSKVSKFWYHPVALISFYEGFSARIDLLLIIIIWLGVVLCPCYLSAEVQQSCWYTHLILATWSDQFVLFFGKFVHPSLAFEDNIVVASNEFMVRTKWLSLAPIDVLVKHMENLWIQCWLLDVRRSPPAPCLVDMHSFPDTSVSRLMIYRLILKSFDVADVNIANNCITALVLRAWTAS